MELKKYCIYLIVILIILSLYFKLFGWTISEGMTPQDQKDMQLGMVLFFYDGILKALQDARDANDTFTENYIQNKIMPMIMKDAAPILNSADPQDIIRMRAKMEEQAQKDKDEGMPHTGMYLQFKEQAIRTNYKYTPLPSSLATSIQTSATPATPATPATQNLFDDNQQLYNSFTAYNTAYNTYATCVEGTYNSQTATYDSSYNADSKTFSSTTCNPASLNSSYNTLMSNISQANIDTSSMNKSTGLTSIDDLKKNENNIKNLRSELDLKLQDLYSIQDSLPKMNQTSVDSTTFAFLLWTVLASSMLLYIFIPSSNTTSTV